MMIKNPCGEIMLIDMHRANEPYEEDLDFINSTKKKYIKFGPVWAYKFVFLHTKMESTQSKKFVRNFCTPTELEKIAFNLGDL